MIIQNINSPQALQAPPHLPHHCPLDALAAPGLHWYFRHQALDFHQDTPDQLERVGVVLRPCDQLPNQLLQFQSILCRSYFYAAEHIPSLLWPRLVALIVDNVFNRQANLLLTTPRTSAFLGLCTIASSPNSTSTSMIALLRASSTNQSTAVPWVLLWVLSSEYSVSKLAYLLSCDSIAALLLPIWASQLSRLREHASNLCQKLLTDCCNSRQLLVCCYNLLAIAWFDTRRLQHWFVVCSRVWLTESSCCCLVEIVRVSYSMVMANWELLWRSSCSCLSSELWVCFICSFLFLYSVSLATRCSLSLSRRLSLSISTLQSAHLLSNYSFLSWDCSNLPRILLYLAVISSTSTLSLLASSCQQSTPDLPSACCAVNFSFRLLLIWMSSSILTSSFLFSLLWNSISWVSLGTSTLNSLSVRMISVCCFDASLKFSPSLSICCITRSHISFKSVKYTLRVFRLSKVRDSMALSSDCWVFLYFLGDSRDRLVLDGLLLGLWCELVKLYRLEDNESPSASVMRHSLKKVSLMVLFISSPSLMLELGASRDWMYLKCREPSSWVGLVLRRYFRSFSLSFLSSQMSCSSNILPLKQGSALLLSSSQVQPPTESTWFFCCSITWCSFSSCFWLTQLSSYCRIFASSFLRSSSIFLILSTCSLAILVSSLILSSQYCWCLDSPSRCDTSWMFLRLIAYYFFSAYSFSYFCFSSLVILSFSSTSTMTVLSYETYFTFCSISFSYFFSLRSYSALTLSSRSSNYFSTLVFLQGFLAQAFLLAVFASSSIYLFLAANSSLVQQFSSCIFFISWVELRSICLALSSQSRIMSSSLPFSASRPIWILPCSMISFWYCTITFCSLMFWSLKALDSCLSSPSYTSRLRHFCSSQDDSLICDSMRRVLEGVGSYASGACLSVAGLVWLIWDIWLMRLIWLLCRISSFMSRNSSVIFWWICSKEVICLTSSKYRCSHSPPWSRPGACTMVSMKWRYTCSDPGLKYVKNTFCVRGGDTSSELGFVGDPCILTVRLAIALQLTADVWFNGRVSMCGLSWPLGDTRRKGWPWGWVRQCMLLDWLSPLEEGLLSIY